MLPPRHHECGHRLYRYVGPEEIAEAVRTHAPGHAVGDSGELSAALLAIAGSGRQAVTCTYVVDRFGTLRLADRASEHVACAGGGPVFAAGEIAFARDGTVELVSNQSTGFCPEISCWDALVAALDRAGLSAPETWDAACEFRRCVDCGAQTLVKESVFECVECATALPMRWNFDRTLCRRSFVTVGDARWVVDTIEEAAESDEDRVGATSDGDSLTLCVADGAGGSAHGRDAAESVISALSATAAAAAILRRVDHALAEGAGGQCAAALARIEADGRVLGASAGDCEAWARAAGGWRELTREQSRKPLVGTGRAQVVSFEATPVERLLLVSDGFHKYVAWQRALSLAEEDAPHTPWRLADAARLPSGALRDDLACILAVRVRS